MSHETPIWAPTRTGPRLSLCISFVTIQSICHGNEQGKPCELRNRRPSAMKRTAPEVFRKLSLIHISEPTRNELPLRWRWWWWLRCFERRNARQRISILVQNLVHPLHVPRWGQLLHHHLLPIGSGHGREAGANMSLASAKIRTWKRSWGQYVILPDLARLEHTNFTMI